MLEEPIRVSNGPTGAMDNKKNYDFFQNMKGGFSMVTKQNTGKHQIRYEMDFFFSLINYLCIILLELNAGREMAMTLKNSNTLYISYL